MVKILQGLPKTLNMYEVVFEGGVKSVKELFYSLTLHIFFYIIQEKAATGDYTTKKHLLFAL
jgi:hypothetical protein